MQRETVLTIATLSWSGYEVAMAVSIDKRWCEPISPRYLVAQV
ncbi:hypothetical protein A2U01_0034985 [Trifolium medium]|uniref:Uncharacterized protein n=1 Tax=Trifolium medium TaxID=97028 RepID=A0A392PP32_9FABA|nr:hypothetical protein [Trifolium medium]